MKQVILGAEDEYRCKLSKEVGFFNINSLTKTDEAKTEKTSKKVVTPIINITELIPKLLYRSIVVKKLFKIEFILKTFI